MAETSGSFLDGFWMEGDSLAPPCQADYDVVDAMIELADLSKDSNLFDLGCGDGRICVRASSRYGCRSAGCEIEERLIEEFRLLVADNSLSDLVEIIHDDLTRIDMSQATHICVYLLPESIDHIKPKLIEALQRGVVLIFNTWGLKDANILPSKVLKCGFCENVTLLRYDKSSIV
jgi:SAM-dependent methyltransferase